MLKTILAALLIASSATAQSYQRLIGRHRGLGDRTITVPHYDPALDPSGEGALHRVNIEICFAHQRQFAVLQSDTPGVATFDGPLGPPQNIPFAYTTFDCGGLATSTIVYHASVINILVAGGTGSTVANYTNITDTLLTDAASLAQFMVSGDVSLVCHLTGVFTFHGTFGGVAVGTGYCSFALVTVSYNPVP